MRRAFDATLAHCADPPAQSSDSDSAAPSSGSDDDDDDEDDDDASAADSSTVLSTPPYSDAESSSDEAKTAGRAAPPRPPAAKRRASTRRRQSLLAELSSGWERHYEEGSDPPAAYYFNPATGVTQWERPPGWRESPAQPPGAPRAGAGAAPEPGSGSGSGGGGAVIDWEEIWSEEESALYYYCAATGEAVWDRPEGFGAPANAPGAEKGEGEELSASELRKRYQRGGTVKDDELTAAQLRAR